jgi:molybdopterin synthase sulfur carrier subunit
LITSDCYEGPGAECPAFLFAMATVVIPSLLRKFTGGIERVDVPGRTMGELIRNLGDRFPGIADQLIENGDIRASVAVSIDGEMMTGGVLDTVGADSEVYFIPALGGG